MKTILLGALAGFVWGKVYSLMPHPQNTIVDWALLIGGAAVFGGAIGYIRRNTRD